MSGRQKILIVDDREENLRALEKTLRETGAEIVKAPSGDEALRASLDHEFALAILDVQMPTMDGCELAEHLRGDPKTRHLPLVFVTAANADEVHVFNGYEAGAVDFIVKPCDPAVLLNKARVFLELDSQRLELTRHREHLEELVEQRTAQLQREVAERQQAQEALREAAAELACSNKELEQFAYAASHDLQEPLRKLLAFTDLLRKDLGDHLPERANKDMGFITESAGRMRELVDRTLELSRVRSCAREDERVSLAECSGQAIDMLSVRVAETSAEITRDELPEVRGDRTMLTQVYQNLIGNALKFAGERRPVIRLTAERTDGHWVMGVKDNGIGIKPEHCERIFLPFKRLHGRAEYEGTGMGLAICRRCVERHGGLIWVESEQGRGAHFKFTLNGDGEP